MDLLLRIIVVGVLGQKAHSGGIIKRYLLRITHLIFLILTLISIVATVGGWFGDTTPLIKDVQQHMEEIR